MEESLYGTRHPSHGEYIKQLFHENKESRQTLEMNRSQMDAVMQQLKDISLQLQRATDAVASSHIATPEGNSNVAPKVATATTTLQELYPSSLLSNSRNVCTATVQAEHPSSWKGRPTYHGSGTSATPRPVGSKGSSTQPPADTSLWPSPRTAVPQGNDI